jgi:iron complex outermembrane recepter protein
MRSQYRWLGFSCGLLSILLGAPMGWAVDAAGTVQKEKILSQTSAQNAQLLKVTGVKLNPTAAGLEIILETESGETIQPVTRTQGNTLSAEIPNAVLALSNESSFAAENPAAGVVRVTVVQGKGQTVQVRVVGETTAPKAIVAVRPKAPETAQQAPEEELGEEEELVVTGQQEGGYVVPKSNVGTRTNAKLRDVPQGIQVIPRQVIEDQAANDIEDVLRNVSGVAQQGGDPAREIRIRGFDATDNIVSDGIGISDGTGQIDFDLGNVEQVEVLKGPSSVLYGSGEPGGTVNITTKRPQKDPFYELTGKVGNFDYYQGAIDLTGPINKNKSILYRLNAAYKNEGSFVDFAESREFAIFPVLSFQLGKNTTFTLEGRYENQSEILPPGLPVIGTIQPNPLGQIPNDRFLGEPDFNRFKTSQGDIGYRLDHRISENWSVRNQFRASFLDSDFRAVFFDSLDADNRTVLRSANKGETKNQRYTLQTDVNGKVKTGIVSHDLLVGLELERQTGSSVFRDAANTPSIDLFEPVYGNLPSNFRVSRSDKFAGNTIGIYAQDLLSIGDKVKILIGGRFDWFQETFEDRLAEESGTNSSTGFSPRVGIVYQPIKLISLYAGWSRSFTPNLGVDDDGNRFKPLTGEQFEVGVKSEFLDGKLAATLSAYQITRRNDFIPDPNNPGFEIQIGEQRSRGVEFDLTGEPLPGLRLIATYAYVDAKITEDPEREGNRLGSVPQHSGRLWAVYEFQKGSFLPGFGIGAGLFASSSFPGNSEDDAFRAPGFVRADALLYYRRKNWRVQLNIENLFDKEYFETPFGGVVYGAPFTIKGTVSVTF